MLGEQYADVLQRNPNAQGVARDCKEVIDASLAAMEHYNRMAMALRNMTSGMRRGPAPAGATPIVQATQASGKAACSCTDGTTCPSCSKGS
jgi:hypothetical protein